MEAFKARVASGPRPKLTGAQRQQIPDLLRKGAEHYGFMGAVWTTTRVAEVIHRTFGVSYHPDHVRRLLHGLRWSVQKPVRRASQRNEAAIRTWREERWPEIKRGLKTSNGPSSGSMQRAAGSCLA